jgi:hypothetical protein
LGGLGRPPGWRSFADDTPATEVQSPMNQSGGRWRSGGSAAPLSCPVQSRRRPGVEAGCPRAETSGDPKPISRRLNANLVDTPLRLAAATEATNAPPSRAYERCRLDVKR